MDVTLPQPPPVKNDGPCVQDLVIADLTSLQWDMRHAIAMHAFSSFTMDYVKTDIRKRKEQGLKKYGTVLQPHNGRNALVDAYQEALDLAQYLRQLKEEGAIWIDPSYRQALLLACHIRQLTVDLGL